MKKVAGALTLAALVAAVVAGISFSHNRRLKERERAEYFDRISPHL